MVEAVPAAGSSDRLGRYEVLMPLGHGGMAEVSLGRLRGAAGFSKLVVLKRMHAHLSHDKRFIELFINEGRVVAQLSHPNICQVYELGEEAGGLFLAMEYLPGVSLEELVRVWPRDNPEELALLAGIAIQACAGLHHAHSLRDHGGAPTPVVHRDVSPQNLFITTEGVCKVLDFGVAKVSTTDRFSQSGMIKGKLPYMAPEQIRGARVDARTDVFAMGIVLWEILTGRRLFWRESDYLIWKAIIEDPIPPLAQLRPELPREVQALVGRALSRAPEQRFASIAELGRELGRAAPTPFDPPQIADALRALCGDRLAENAAKVARALAAADAAPGTAATGAATDTSAAETLHSGILPSVVLRDEAVVVGRDAPDAPDSPDAVTTSAERAPHRHRPTATPAGWRRRGALLGAALALALGAAAWAVLGGGAPGPRAVATPTADARLELAQATDDRAAARATAAPDAAGGLTAAPDAAGGLTAAPDAAGDLAAPPDAAQGDGASDEPRRSTAHNGERRRPRGASKPSTGPARAPVPTTPPATPDAAGATAVDAAPGYYSVDSRPYATIYIDGVARGETPLYRVPLAAGKHQVRAVRADGTVRSFSISIPAGKEVSSGQLRW